MNGKPYGIRRFAYSTCRIVAVAVCEGGKDLFGDPVLWWDLLLFEASGLFGDPPLYGEVVCGEVLYGEAPVRGDRRRRSLRRRGGRSA